MGLDFSHDSIKLKVEYNEVMTFCAYCKLCEEMAFIEEHVFIRPDKIREKLMQFTIHELSKRLMETGWKYKQRPTGTKITLKLNYAERVTLSVMFKRVNVPADFAAIERNILTQLII